MFAMTDTHLDLYLRLSDLRDADLNDDGLSKGLVEHERLLREFVARLGGTVAKIITENDMSGGKPKPASAYKRRKVILPDGSTVMRVIRPGFRELLSRIATGQSRGFLAVDLDRACRDPRDLEDLLDVVEAAKATVASLTGTLRLTDGGTSDERTMARMMVNFANKSSSDTARRVSAARLRQALNGEYGGGRRPYGFEPDGVTVHKGEAEEIVKMSRAVLSTPDIPLRSIARGLRVRGVPTVTGTRWSSETVRSILLRPRNAGIMVHKGQEVGPAPWEPIITLDVFRGVVAKLTNPDRRTTPGPAPKWLGSGIYLCNCGSVMTVQRRSHDKGATPTYRCRDRVVGKNPHMARRTVDVDQIVERAIVKRLSRPDAVDLVTPATPEIDVPALRNRATALREQLDEFARDKADGLITRAQMIAGTQRVNVKLERIEQQLASVIEVSPLSDLVGAADVQATWEALPLGVKRAVLVDLVAVMVRPTRRGRFHGADPESVAITWKR